MNNKVIQCDTRQKNNHHLAKEQYFKEQGYKLINSKLMVGDYMFPSQGHIAVDTKKDIGELYSNLIQGHKRFRAECELAKECGIQLYILVENKDGVRNVREVTKWKNYRMLKYFRDRNHALKLGITPPPQPATNVQLMKIMQSMQTKYGVKFMFCTPSEAGQRVIELLEGKE